MSKKGVLLLNLGSPDSPNTDDVRRYLREFLMDPRVLDAPFLVRFAVVHGTILPFRPSESAEAYHKIWTAEGSPLIATSKRVQNQLRGRVPLPVELAMRYQNPSIKTALGSLSAQAVDELLLIPMFPHYAMSSYETAVERVKELLGRTSPQMKLQVVPPYYDHPAYISALVASATPYLKHGFDHLLFSFHGVPERHLHKTDPTGSYCLNVKNCCEGNNSAHATCYRAQCFKTVRAFAAAAQLPETKYSVAFQSRLGRDPWLRPYTDHELARFAEEGIKSMAVICPAFVTDCLETIEEIGLRGRETFLEAGGREFQLIPCLNEHPDWLAFLERSVREFVSDGGEGVFASRRGDGFH